MTPLDVLKRFLELVFTGDLDTATSMVGTAAEFVAGPAAGHARVGLYGRYVGPSGAREMFRQFSQLLEPGEFTVSGSLHDRETAVMYGTLKHRVRATGREFSSSWVLVATVRHDQLVSYQFHEDTAALVEAVTDT
jgi:hypothetical protein